MRDLRDIIKDIQRELGVEADGIAGRVTLTGVLSALRAGQEQEGEVIVPPFTSAEMAVFDDRSEGILATLDPKAVPLFRRFLALAQGTAATLGCEYKLISGNRTWAEQDALNAKRPKVTNAKGGQSNHNFGIAADAGVFQGKLYLDGGTAQQKALASKVHKACSMHADACGLEWGGNWTSIVDQPHYEVNTGLSMAEKRSRFTTKGSVL